MKEKNYDEAKKTEVRKQLELDFIRIRRMRLSQNSFETRAVIGRGAFGEVQIYLPLFLTPSNHFWLGAFGEDERDGSTIRDENAQKIRNDQERTGNLLSLVCSIFGRSDYAHLPGWSGVPYMGRAGCISRQQLLLRAEPMGGFPLLLLPGISLCLCS